MYLVGRPRGRGWRLVVLRKSIGRCRRSGRRGSGACCGGGGRCWSRAGFESHGRRGSHDGRRGSRGGRGGCARFRSRDGRGFDEGRSIDDERGGRCVLWRSRGGRVSRRTARLMHKCQHHDGRYDRGRHRHHRTANGCVPFQPVVPAVALHSAVGYPIALEIDRARPSREPTCHAPISVLASSLRTSGGSSDPRARVAACPRSPPHLWRSIANTSNDVSSRPSPR